MNRFDRRLIEGSVLKSLVTLSLPIIAANLLQTAYQLTDTFWVGRLGSDAVAAVSLSFPIIFLLISFGAGLSMAGTILVSQFKGKEDHEKTDHIAAQTFLVVGVFALFLTVIGYMLSPYLLQIMNVEPNVYEDALAYLRITFLGNIPIFFYYVFQSVLRGAGDVKTPMYIVLLAVLLNLALDPLFIFGFWFIPGSGVQGAALASVGTQGLSAFIGIYLMFGNRFPVRLHLKDLKPDFKLIKEMVKLGFPSSIEQSARSLGMTVMIFLVTGFGTTIIAAYGIGSRILSFVLIPAMGLSMSTSTLVGQNMGAGKTERAERIVKVSGAFGFGVLTLMGLLLYLYAQELSAFFIPGEIATINASEHFIQIMALTFGFIGIQLVMNGAFRGSGSTKAAMVMTIVSLWVLRFPVAYYLSFHTSLNELGLWISFPVSNILSAAMTTIWFYRGKWKEKDLTGRKEEKFKKVYTDNR